MVVAPVPEPSLGGPGQAPIRSRAGSGRLAKPKRLGDMSGKRGAAIALRTCANPATDGRDSGTRMMPRACLKHRAGMRQASAMRHPRSSSKTFFAGSLRSGRCRRLPLRTRFERGHFQRGSDSGDPDLAIETGEKIACVFFRDAGTRRNGFIRHDCVLVLHMNSELGSAVATRSLRRGGKVRSRSRASIQAVNRTFTIYVNTH